MSRATSMKRWSAIEGGFAGGLEPRKSGPRNLILPSWSKASTSRPKGFRFRVSLARNSLQVDTNPTPISVSQFATHLIAEIYQLALAEKRSAGAGGGKKEDAKVKKLDEGVVKKGKNIEGKMKEMEVHQPCKFFLTDSGCRRGKDCR